MYYVGTIAALPQIIWRPEDEGDSRAETAQCPFWEFNIYQ